MGDRIWIAFPYDRALVDAVRALPGRVFDRASKDWWVPAAHVEEVLSRLGPLDFEVGEALEEWCLANAIDPGEVTARARRERQPLIDLGLLPSNTWTLDRLNDRVRGAIRREVRDEVWLAAEVNGYDRGSKRGGHAFFELVHRAFAGEDPVARAPAVMWAADREAIERELREDGGQVRLRDGLIVRVKVRADLYTGTGRYQLAVSEIDLAHTTGTIHQRREAIIRRLQSEGVLDDNRGLAWPSAPLRIGLITRSGSDAYEDFLDELRRSGYGFDVTVHDASMQGANTEASVLAALAYFARRAARYDAVAIVRGGGSRSDLAYFDTDRIGDAVCAHPVKVIAGVGHQRDVCLLDAVAHSEKTPTAAAQFFVARLREYTGRQREIEEKVLARAEELVEAARGRLSAGVERAARVTARAVEREARRLDATSWAVATAANTRLERRRQRFDAVANALPRAAGARLALERQRLDFAGRKVDPRALERAVEPKRERLERAVARLERATGRRLERESARLVEPAARLERAVGRRLERASAALTERAERLRLLDPERVLERGFAIVRRGGKVVRGAGALSTGDVLSVEMVGGAVRAVVTEEE
jgi:exodeoxyribonuclease VII large subunit